MKREHYLFWFYIKGLIYMQGFFLLCYITHIKEQNNTILSKEYRLVEIESNKNLDFAKKAWK